MAPRSLRIFCECCGKEIADAWRVINGKITCVKCQKDMRNK